MHACNTPVQNVVSPMQGSDTARQEARRNCRAAALVGPPPPPDTAIGTLPALASSYLVTPLSPEMHMRHRAARGSATARSDAGAHTTKRRTVSASSDRAAAGAAHQERRVGGENQRARARVGEHARAVGVCGRHPEALHEVHLPAAGPRFLTMPPEQRTAALPCAKGALQAAGLRLPGNASEQQRAALAWCHGCACTAYCRWRPSTAPGKYPALMQPGSAPTYIPRVSPHTEQNGRITGMAGAASGAQAAEGPPMRMDAAARRACVSTAMPPDCSRRRRPATTGVVPWFWPGSQDVTMPGSTCADAATVVWYLPCSTPGGCSCPACSVAPAARTTSACWAARRAWRCGLSACSEAALCSALRLTRRCCRRPAGQLNDCQEAASELRMLKATAPTGAQRRPEDNQQIGGGAGASSWCAALYHQDRVRGASSLQGLGTLLETLLSERGQIPGLEVGDVAGARQREVQEVGCEVELWHDADRRRRRRQRRRRRRRRRGRRRRRVGREVNVLRDHGAKLAAHVEVLRARARPASPAAPPSMHK